MNGRIHRTPSIGIMSQSDRTDKITNPLATTKLNYTVDPSDPYEHDILIAETPDRDMFRRVLSKPLHRDTTLLFRMRGDPYWGIHHWMDNRVKQKIALQMLRYVDGCVAIAPHQAEKYAQKTGNATHIVPLSIDADEWPDTNHTDEELRIVSLTNCWYPAKFKALIEGAPAVERALDRHGGQWIIGGKGRHAERLQEEMAKYEHIDFRGYVNATETLDWANLMLHLSYFDSFANAILEGMAASLPVITTDHVAFTDQNLPVHATDGLTNLDSVLADYTDADHRQTIGDRNQAHVREFYNHERVGSAWNTALLDFHRRALPETTLYTAHSVCQP